MTKSLTVEHSDLIQELQQPLVETFSEEITTSPEIEGVKDHDDFSKSLTLSDGTYIRLRDITAKDLLHMEQVANSGKTTGNLQKTALMLEMLTVEYKGETGITKAQVEKLKAKDFVKLGEVVGSFL